MEYSIIVYAHKISFLSNWIIPLSNFLNAKIVVFHINNIDKERIADFNQKNIELIDVSFIRLVDLKEKIIQIDPRFMLFLGFRSLIEVLLLQLSQKLEIKTIYLEHGLYTRDTTKLNFKRLFLQFEITSIKYFYFVSKYVAYIKDYGLGELTNFYSAFIRRKFVKLKFNRYFFFSKHGFDGMKETFFMRDEEVVFCGYPLFLNSSDHNFEIDDDATLKSIKEVLYIHQPFILNKQSTLSYNDEKEYLIVLKNRLEEFRTMKMTILLHPREDLDRYRNLYSDCGIEVIQSPNDYRVFLNKSVIFGHYSTALLYPLYFKINIVILKYPDLNMDNLFVKYGDYYESPQFVSPTIFDNNDRKENIEYLIGSSNSFEHVAGLLANEL